MKDLFLYIIQINFLLSLLFLGYYFLLRKLTFYKLNRIYFLAGAGYALVYPFIDFKSPFAERSIPVVSEAFMVFYGPVKASAASGISLMNILLGAAAVGGLFFTILLLLRLLAVYRIHRDSSPAVWEIYSYREVPYKLHPFAFFKVIYLHQKQHSPVKLETIFKHEYIHVKGLHTLDVLLYELLRVMNWFNPLIGLMRNSVRQNLEYLTDQQVLDRGVDRRDYQYALAGLAQHKTPDFPGNTFSFKPLKNRIMMMNKKPSSRFHLGKYLFLLPALVFIGVGFTAALAQDKMEGLTQKTQEVVWKTGKTANHTENEQIQEEEPLFVVNGKTYDRATIDIMDPSTIEEINVLKDESAIEKYGEKGKYGVIEVALKEGEEVPVLTDGKKTQAFDRYKRGLFFIDGKESSFEEAQELKPNQIKRMSVIKQPGSVAEYGEKAKNGVVKIKLKRKGENTEPGNPRDLPLYIVNGKKKSFKEVEKLGPDQIESIDVLKDKELIAEYGEEGKNGVVIISLKKHAN